MTCKRCVSGFYEERVPQFRQGAPRHELEEYVTAEDCTFMVNKIEQLADLLAEARRDWIADTRWEGDQYGGVTVPNGEALIAFGKRIDDALKDRPK